MHLRLTSKCKCAILYLPKGSKRKLNLKGVAIMTNIEKVYQSIESEKQRSAWDKGVTKYALELVEQLGEQIDNGYFDELDLTESKKVRAALLNGAAVKRFIG